MKRVFVSAAILASVIAAAPVVAQPGPYNRGGWDRNEFWRGAPDTPYERIQFLQRRIDQGVRDGSLDRREYRRAQNELNRIRATASVYRRNGFNRQEVRILDDRLDNLSRNLRWARGNWSNRGDVGRDRWATDYDASRYYRNGPQYQERYLTSNDYVYRGSDGRYYCKRDDGTTGLIVGGLAGGVLGNLIDGGGNRVAGTLIGGALGAIAGREIDRSSNVRCR